MTRQMSKNIVTCYNYSNRFGPYCRMIYHSMHFEELVLLYRPLIKQYPFLSMYVTISLHDPIKYPIIKYGLAAVTYFLPWTLITKVNQSHPFTGFYTYGFP